MLTNPVDAPVSQLSYGANQKRYRIESGMTENNSA